MFMIKWKSNLYKLPVNVTESNEVLQYICSILHVDDNEFILSFNNIFLSTYFNYKLLEIGYNPYEILELTKIKKKKAIFTILNFDHIYLNVNQFTNAFSVKEHFAKIFYTIPQNIIIKYRNEELLDSDKIINFETDQNEIFQITVDKNYFLVRTYLHEPHLICMPLNSTVKNLKNTISIYSQKVHQTIETECEYSHELIEMCKQNNIEKEEVIDSRELQNLCTLIPLFEFTESKSINSEVYTITVHIKDDEFDILLIRNYQSSCTINLYSLTVLIEKDLGIDRGLFKPFDKSDSPIQLDINVTPENNTFFFKITDHLHVNIDDSIQEKSYLTTIRDIQKLNSFECHNFGIAINDQFAYHDDNGKFMLAHFMNEIKNPENATKLLIKKSTEPCYQTAFIKEKEEGEKQTTKNIFIIPKKMKLEEEITKIYLHQNYNSIEIISRNKEEIIYSNSEKQTIYYILIDKSKKKHEKSIELIGQNLRVIDLIQAIYNEKNAKIFNFKINKIISKSSIAVPFLNDKKLNFWEYLSTVFTDEQNPITIKCNEERKYLNILCLLDDSFSIEKVQFKSKLCANEIINNYCKSKGITTKNLKIYADFNELAPSDIPSLLKLKKPFLIINQETEQKTLVIKNASNFKFEYTIQKVDYSNLAYLISTMFMMHEDELTFTASFDQKDYKLPSKFDAGSFPERCEILVHYEYEKKSHMTFLYENETKTINVDVDEPIEQIIPIIQNEFNILHLSKSSIYLSLFDFSFDSSQSFASYKLPDNVVINVCKKDSSFPIKISTPEYPEFEDFYFDQGDKIENVIEHFATKFGRDFIIYKNMKRTILMKTDTKLKKDKKLYLSCELISLKCEGSIGDDEIEVSEILKVKETAKYLTEKMESNVYIFTKNDQNNCYEAVDEEKRLYEIESDVFVHQTFSKIEFNFPIFNGDEHISEMNTIRWLKENFISKYLLINPEDFVIKNESKKPLGDLVRIKSVFNKLNEKYQIEIGKGIAKRKPYKRYFLKRFKPVGKVADFPKSEPPKTSKAAKESLNLKTVGTDSPKSEKKSKEKSPTLKNKKKNGFTEGSDDDEEIQPESSDEFESPKATKKSSKNKNKSKKVNTKEIEDEKLNPKSSSSKTSKKSPNHKKKNKNSSTADEIEKEESKPSAKSKKSSIDDDESESPKIIKLDGEESTTPKSEKSSKKSSKHKKKKESSEGIEKEKSSPSKKTKKSHNHKKTDIEDSKKIESPSSAKMKSKHKKKVKKSSTEDIEDSSPTPKSETPKLAKAHSKPQILKDIKDDKEPKSRKSKIKKGKSLAVINEIPMISDEEKGEQKTEKDGFETPKNKKNKKHNREDEEEQNSESSRSPKHKKNSLKKKQRIISDDDESKSAREPKKKNDDDKTTDESSSIKKKLLSISDDEEIEMNSNPSHEKINKDDEKEKEPSSESSKAHETSSDIKNKSPIASDDGEIDSKPSKEPLNIKKKSRSVSDDDEPKSDLFKTEKTSKKKSEDEENCTDPESKSPSDTKTKFLLICDDEESKPESSKEEKTSKKKCEEESEDSDSESSESSKPSKTAKDSSILKKKLRSVSDDDEPKSDSSKTEKASKKKSKEEEESYPDPESKSPSDTKAKLLHISDDEESESESESSREEKTSKKKCEEESEDSDSETSELSKSSKTAKESSILKKKLRSVSDDEDLESDSSKVLKASSKKGEKEEENSTDFESKSSSGTKMKLLIISDDEEIETESSEESTTNADYSDFSSDSEKNNNDKQEINDETKSPNIEEESISDDIDFSKAYIDVRKSFKIQKKKTEKDSDKNIKNKIESPKEKDEEDKYNKDKESKKEVIDDKSKEEVIDDKSKEEKEDKNETKTIEKSSEIKEINRKEADESDDKEEDDDDDEEEESEEDIFRKTAKNIFRFLSVSFFDNLHRKKIGRGATSIVYKIHHVKYPNKFFALKIIDLDTFNEYDESDDENNANENSDNEDEPPKLDVDKMRRFYLEYEVLNKLDHPNIVKTYGMFQGDENHAPAILLEYCPYNLKKVIKKLSNEERVEAIFKLSSAMQKIHELGIIHRDLKPENILIGVDKQIKVSDFGLCTFIEIDNETISRTQFAGTMKFMAPELINEQKDYNEKVDVYSFGVVVYWILMKGEYPSIKLVEVASGKQAKIPDTMSEFSTELIQRCWSLKPKDRPSFNEICEILKTRRNELIK